MRVCVDLATRMVCGWADVGKVCPLCTTISQTPTRATVPLYDTLGASAIQYVIEHAEVSVVFVSAAKFKDLVRFSHPLCISLLC